MGCFGSLCCIQHFPQGGSPACPPPQNSAEDISGSRKIREHILHFPDADLAFSCQYRHILQRSARSCQSCLSLAICLNIWTLSYKKSANFHIFLLFIRSFFVPLRPRNSAHRNSGGFRYNFLALRRAEASLNSINKVAKDRDEH